MSTHRKSVAFSEDTKVVGSNGEVTEINGTSEKTSAESHSTGISISPLQSKVTETLTGETAPEPSESKSDPAVDEVNELFKGLNKKKKSSKKPKDEAAEGGDEPAPAADGEFDPSALKKKKKKKVPKADTEDFEAKLAEAGVKENGDAKGDAATAAPEEAEETEGNMIQGTGIWAHNEEKAIKYDKLLERFFAHLHSAHPDLLSSGSKSYVIPPPQCLREGNKKTIFANIPDICKRMKRSEEHVMQFIFAELGTSGSVDGSRRLVIKGRFQQKQIENVLRRYIGEYVTCKTCRSPDTELSKGESRLYFVTCNSCGSRTSVTAIKTGYSAQVGKRKRIQT
ncbi:translation initiation factor eIF-2 beta subunit [Lecanora helva]